MKTKKQLFENKVREIVKEELLREDNRIEDLADIQTLNKFKASFRLLVADWKQEGFDNTDILKYLNKLLNTF